MDKKLIYQLHPFRQAERQVSRIGACFVVTDPEKFQNIFFLDTTRLLVYNQEKYTGKLLYKTIDGPLIKATTKDDSNFDKAFEDRFGFILLPESANETEDLLQYYQKQII